MGKRFVIVGASSRIAQAMAHEFLSSQSCEQLFLIAREPKPLPDSRATALKVLYDRPDSWAQAVSEIGPAIDGVFVATGFLHDEKFQPEKNLLQLSASQFEKSFFCNTIIPALAAQALCPLLTKARPSFFSVLSARVGSISDNKLGGWYSYRCAKAALNMLIKNLSLELRRTHPQSFAVGLHPGTVATGLSEPFLSRQDPQKIFTPEMSAAHLSSVLAQLDQSHSGHCFDWAGKLIDP